MRDPLEGLSESGMIRTGADMIRVDEAFRPVPEAASAMILERDISASVYAYGSIVTGQANVGVSDVDLLTIGLPPSDANSIGAELTPHNHAQLSVARHTADLPWRNRITEPCGGS